MNDLLTTIIVVGMVILLGSAMKKSITKFQKGCCGSSGDTFKVSDKNINNYSYHIVCEVKGMHCGNCAKRIEMVFNHRGDTYTKADYKRGIVDIYLKEDLQDNKIISIIASNGYEVINLRR